jgi:hypothetical protein
MEEQFLFPGDREKQTRDREKERRSRIFGTPEFHFAYAQYIKSPEWQRLCRLVKKRAGNLCERSHPGAFCSDRLSVHHLTYDRFMQEKLTDLQLLCDPHHELADREREKRAREAFEQAGEEAMDAAGMNTYFTKKYGEDWWLQFGSDIASAYEEWDDWKERKADEEAYDY